MSGKRWTVNQCQNLCADHNCPHTKMIAACQSAILNWTTSKIGLSIANTAVKMSNNYTAHSKLRHYEVEFVSFLVIFLSNRRLCWLIYKACRLHNYCDKFRHPIITLQGNHISARLQVWSACLQNLMCLFFLKIYGDWLVLLEFPTFILVGLCDWA